MLNLNQSSINSANNASQFDAGNVLAREAEKVYAEGLEKMQAPFDADKMTERQREIMTARLDEWKGLVEKAYNDIISRRASWMPWTVCGPARYDGRKNSARADRQREAEIEWGGKMDRFIDNTVSMIRDAIPFEQMIAEYRTGKRRDAISGDDPAAVEKLEARIAFLNDEREEGKRRNAYWRKNKTMRGYVCRDGSTIEARADEIDSSIRSGMYGVPCPPYELQNTLQNVKRLEERLKEARQRRETAQDASTARQEASYSGFSVEIAAADARIYIHFDDKPEEDARKVLKENGFHWSPRLKVWTRQHTTNAERALRRYVVPGLLATGKYGEQPEAVSLDDFAAKYAPES